MKISAIIINYNTSKMTTKAIEIFKKKAQNFKYEIILIDNNSTDKISAVEVERLGVRLIANQENLGFAKAVNQGMKLAKGEYVLLLNSDVLMLDDNFQQMIEFMDSEQKVGIIGPKLVHPQSKNIQASCGRFPTLTRELMKFLKLYKILPVGTMIYPNYFNRRKFIKNQEVDWVSGGCMLIRRKLIEQIGNMDEHYFFGVEDMDFCFRAKQKRWLVVFFPLYKVFHYHGLSSGGKRSLFSLKNEKTGIDYFFKKFYPQKNISRLIVGLLYKIKLFILSI